MNTMLSEFPKKTSVLRDALAVRFIDLKIVHSHFAETTSLSPNLQQTLNQLCNVECATTICINDPGIAEITRCCCETVAAGEVVWKQLNIPQ